MEYIDLGLPSGTLWEDTNETNTDGTPYFTFDEAVAKFGESMPTKEDFEELLRECYHRWNDERKGIEFYSPKTQQVLFLPASGLRLVSGVSPVQYYNNYWSATPNGSSNAHFLYFNSITADLYNSSRYVGRAVRLIKRGGTQ